MGMENLKASGKPVSGYFHLDDDTFLECLVVSFPSAWAPGDIRLNFYQTNEIRWYDATMEDNELL